MKEKKERQKIETEPEGGTGEQKSGNFCMREFAGPSIREQKTSTDGAARREDLMGKCRILFLVFFPSYLLPYYIVS